MDYVNLELPARSQGSLVSGPIDKWYIFVIVPRMETLYYCAAPASNAEVITTNDFLRHTSGLRECDVQGRNASLIAKRLSHAMMIYPGAIDAWKMVAVPRRRSLS